MIRNSSPVFVAIIAFAWSGIAGAQTMPDKWDQKCLDDAGRRFIQCNASATSQSAKQQCQKTMDEEKKQCKKK